MKNKARFLSFFLVALFSCGTGSPIGKYDFSINRDNVQVPYFHRNGDMAEVTIEEANYADLTRPTIGRELVQRVRNGFPTILFLYQDSCAHCERFKPIFFETLLDSKMEVFSLGNSSSIREGVGALAEAFPTYASISPATPQVYFLRDEEHYDFVDFNDHLGSVERFERFIGPLANWTQVFTFREEASLSSFLKDHDALCFYDDGSQEALSFYKQSLRYYAERGNKPLCYFDGKNAADNEKSLVLQKYFYPNQASSLSWIKQGEEGYQSASIASPDAKAMIQSYFEVSAFSQA